MLNEFSRSSQEHANNLLITARREGDDVAVRALVNTWHNDSDFSGTRQIQQEIAEAIQRGSIVKTDAYYCCPWSPVYDVKREPVIGGKRIQRGQQFVFDVSAEEIPHGGKFKRELLVGNFSPTDKVDYCPPGQDND